MRCDLCALNFAGNSMKWRMSKISAPTIWGELILGLSCNQRNPTNSRQKPLICRPNSNWLTPMFCIQRLRGTTNSSIFDMHSKQQPTNCTCLSSTLIYQLWSVSPPVNFFAAHSGYDLSWATCWCWTCTVSCRWSWTMYCFAVYHCLLLRAYQANPSDIGIQSA